MAALQDIYRMEIDDRCHIAIAVLSIFSMIFTRDLSLESRVFGTVCVSIPMLVIVLIVPGAFGGGDIKLMMAGGLFLGWKITMKAAVISVFLGGIYSVYLIIKKRADGKTYFPFGPFLCIGMLIGMILEKC